MKSTNRLVIVAAVAAFATFGATAGQHTSASNPTKVSSVRLSTLMDANIQSSSGEELGQLEDLLIDPETGAIKFAVLGRGGLPGAGERLVPVPWKAIQVQSEREFTLNVDKNKLKTAPTTDKQYSNLHDPGYTVTIYRFFAVPTVDVGAGEIPEERSGTGTSEYGTRSSSDTKAGDPANKADLE